MMSKREVVNLLCLCTYVCMYVCMYYIQLLYVNKLNFSLPPGIYTVCKYVFMLWYLDCKTISGKCFQSVFVSGLGQVMQHFKQFMEDYNTATMPHVKFYYYERWEMAEYERKVRQLSAVFDASLFLYVCMYVCL